MTHPFAYARVIVNISARALNHPFTYTIPKEWAANVQVGSVVEAPFGHRQIVGFVVELSDELTSDARGREIRPLTRLIDEVPYWGQEILDLSRFMSRFYGCTWLECLQAAVPGPVMQKAVKALTAKRARTPSRPALEFSAAISAYAPHSLTAEQEQAVQAIEAACHGGAPVLLYGVTGSGKTEVYLQAVERCLARGRQAIVLVPELSLTHQAIQRYQGRLGAHVGVMHSALSASERQSHWWAMSQGQLRVALGTRSAIFAPLQELGLIVIDEEHESSYKQENAPRYHARQVAFKRAQIHGAGLVYGSATPSVESFYLAQQGRYRLVELKERPAGHALPEVNLVDMRTRGRSSRMISPQLAEAMREHLAAHHQVVLFLNKRGFSKYLQCCDCGETLGCPHCSIPLTLHKREGQMLCHYCGFARPIPDECPSCSCLYFRHGGGGTERLLGEVNRLFSNCSVARMDRDTTGRVGAHERILSQFERGEAQILLGTKMITKGLDYPNVTLVGIIDGDEELNMPDFRAGERCFQLLTQVAGRAGRGDYPGQVFLQAHNPENPIVQAALSHDYRSLYEAEIAGRRQLGYPPFSRLVRAVISASDNVNAAYHAERLGQFLRAQRFEGQVVGPAACPLERLQGRYRYHVLVKCANSQVVVDLLSQYISHRAKSLGDVSLVIDSEPQNLS